jgi:putative DNA primase/helicase
MNRIRSAIASARSDRRVFVERAGDTFDQHPHLLNALNGIINLKTGELLPHDPAAMLTHLVGHSYDAKAYSADYDQFLGSLFTGSPAVASYVSRLGGLILTGEVKDQLLHVFVGDGSNGKSVLLELWRHVLGPKLAYIIPTELLTDDGGRSHLTERMGLNGARLAYASETEEDHPLRESLVKSITGADRLSARGVCENRVEFSPSHKTIFCTNFLPRVRGTNSAIWRRLRPVMFARRFWTDADRIREPDREFRDDDRADPDLLNRLKAGAAGVLAMMVQESVGYYRDGLAQPAELIELAAQYRKDEDTLGKFCESVLIADSDARTLSRDIRSAYEEWARGEGYARPFGAESFGKYLAKKYEPGPKTNGLTTYRVRIRSQFELADRSGSTG